MKSPNYPIIICVSGYLYLFDFTFLLKAIISISVPNLPVNIDIVRIINPASEIPLVTPIERPTVENALNSSNTNCKIPISPLASDSDSVRVSKNTQRNKLTSVNSRTAYAFISKSFGIFFL